MSNEQMKLVRSVRPQMKGVFFEYEGTVFRGDPTRVAMEWAYNNPTGGDFYVWLQDHCEVIRK